jgi:hypothetical protein
VASLVTSVETVHYDIHLMTTDKEDEFVEQMMARCDKSMMAAREASQVLEGSVRATLLL